MTVIFIEALLPEPSCVAQVIVVVPALSAVTSPLWSTLAMLGLLLVQTGVVLLPIIVLPSCNTGSFTVVDSTLNGNIVAPVMMPLARTTRESDEVNEIAVLAAAMVK